MIRARVAPLSMAVEMSGCASGTQGRNAVSQPDPPISDREQEVTIQAAYLAAHLGLTVEELRAEMRRGIVFGVTERGIGDDLGRKRLTFCYRARSWSVVIEPDGSFHEADRKP
jgi:hypothetical protein